MCLDRGKHLLFLSGQFGWAVADVNFIRGKILNPSFSSMGETCRTDLFYF